MGKFKDRLDKLGEACEPGGKIVPYKTKIPAPPVEEPPEQPPDEEVPEDGGRDDVCTCISDIGDEIVDEVRNLYPYGPPFNTGKLFTRASTPIELDAATTDPSNDPSIIGFYDDIPVAPRRNNSNARQIWVIADPDGAVDPNNPFLYVRTSNGPSSTYSPEIPVRVGEDWGFRDVYSFRIRAPVEGQQYRITTDPHRTTFVSTIVNVPSGGSTPPVSNRTDFIDLNVSVGIIDSVLPSIIVPNGFALTIRSSVINPIGSKIYTSRTNALDTGSRNTLFAGDAKEYYINNANLIHVAGDRNGLSLDISVEL